MNPNIGLPFVICTETPANKRKAYKWKNKDTGKEVTVVCGSERRSSEIANYHIGTPSQTNGNKISLVSVEVYLK